MGSRYDEERRRQRIMKRRRQVRRRMLMVLGGGLLLIVLMISLCVTGVKRHFEKKQLQAETEAGLKAIQSCYDTFLKTRDEAVETLADTGKKANGFAEWMLEAYPDKKEAILKTAQDKKVTAEEIYAAVGETMHVVNDRYAGYLDDAATAKKHGIYLKDSKVEKKSGKKSAKKETAGKAGASGDEEKSKKSKAGGAAEVLIAGDLCFAEDGFVLDHYDEVKDLSKCISPEILKMTNEADVFYLNHEYCISDRGEPLEGKLYTFRAKPERMELLEEMGTDLVSLANNHVYDYGEDALLDTLDLLDQSKIPYVGGGHNIEEAKRPIYFVVNGIKIGFVAASNAEIVYYTPAATEDSPGILEAYDTAEYKKVIEEASEECDYLIAYIHWGPEDTNYYEQYQHDQGKEFLEAGADIVVGGHPHVLQGMEYIDGKPVIYSMGDFWFNDETKYTGMLKLDIDAQGLKEMSFVPCLQTGYTTQYIKDQKEQAEFYEFFGELSPNAEIDKNGVLREAEKKEAGKKDEQS